MAHTEWIKVVRSGLRKSLKRQSSKDDSRRPTKPSPPPPAYKRGKNSFESLTPSESSSDVKTRSSSSRDRRITGAGFTSVMPKEKFQPAFSKALKARCAFLKRRLSSAEMKNLARSVRRGWTPPKKSLPPKGRKPGLGYIPSQKPKYSDVLKSAKVPAPSLALKKRVEFIQGKTLAPSLGAGVAKASARSVAESRPSGVEAKEAMAKQISAGAKYVLSVQEKSEQSKRNTAKLRLLGDIRRATTEQERLALLRTFALQWGADVLDSFTECVRVWNPAQRHCDVRYRIDYDALGRVPREEETVFVESDKVGLECEEFNAGQARFPIRIFSSVAEGRAHSDGTFSTKPRWSLGVILTQEERSKTLRKSYTK